MSLERGGKTWLDRGEMGEGERRVDEARLGRDDRGWEPKRVLVSKSNEASATDTSALMPT